MLKENMKALAEHTPVLVKNEFEKENGSLMKKITSIIFVLIVCSIFPIYGAFAQGSIMVEENFENYSGGKPDSIKISGAASKYTAYTDDDGNTYLGMNTSLARLYKTFDSEIAKGTIKFDFRFKVNDVSSYMYLRMLTTNWTAVNSSNTEYMIEMVDIRDGVFGYYYNSRGFDDPIQAGSYNADEWHKVSIWLDMDSKKVYYFYDDKYAASENVNTDLDIKGFAFTFVGDDEKSFYIDDINIKMLEYKDIQEQYELSGDVPEYFLDEVYFNIGSENTGNIFFTGDKPILNIETVNRTAEDKNIKLDIVVEDYWGNVIETGQKSIELTAEGKSEFEYTPDISKYGTYKLTVSQSSMEISKKADFSYCVLNKKTTPKYGTNVHMNYKRGNTDKLMPLIKNAGFSMTRDTWSWNEKGDGEHNPTYSTWFTRYYNQSIEMDVDMLAILGITNSKYKDSDGGLATNETGLAALESYAEKFAAYYKGTIKYIEIGNEYNHESKAATPEEYWLCMKAAYNGIKKGNENTKVVGFATASIDIEFIEEVLKLCQEENFYPFDAISVHAYHITRILEKKDQYRHVTWVQYAQRIVDLAKKYGLEDKELWATELGWYTEPCTVGYTVEPIQQAAYYLRNLALNDAYELFDYMTFYDFQDDGVLLTNRDHHWGMIEGYVGEDTPYAAKPSYLAFSNYASLLGDAECVSIEKTEIAQNSSESYCTKYHRVSDNADVYMLWNTVGDIKYTLELPEKSYVKLYDAFGNSEIVTVTDGKINIDIGVVPVYAEVLDIYAEVMLNGNAIYSTEEVRAGDEFEVNIYANTTENFIVFAAEYEENVLKKITAQDKQSFECILKENTDRFKLFIWNDELKPLIKAISVGEQ